MMITKTTKVADLKIDGLKKVYYAHDNGSKPFKIVIQNGTKTKKIVHILLGKRNENDEEYVSQVYPKIFKSFGMAST